MAVKALWNDYRALAVDASFHDTWKSDNPAAVNASLKRKRIEMAIAVLEKLQKEKTT